MGYFQGELADRPRSDQPLTRIRHRCFVSGWLPVVLLAAVLLTCCGTPSEDSAAQQAAAAFINAVYIQQDTELALSLVVPTHLYGNVTRALVEKVIAEEAAQGCRTLPGSVEAGQAGGDVRLATLTDDDLAAGIEARSAWLVGSRYQCAGDMSDRQRISLVVTERVAGVWGVARVEWHAAVGTGEP